MIALYEFVQQERLLSVLDTLQGFTGLPIRLIDRDGTVLKIFGNAVGYCELLRTNLFAQNDCDLLLKKAGQRAQKLGEAYIFSCHADLNHIAYPLTHNGELLASVVVGPFLMDAPDSTLISGLMKNYTLSPTLSLELYDRLSELQVLFPARVSLLKKMMDHLLSPLLPSEQALILQTQEKAAQQARVNETIQIFKEQHLSPDRKVFYEKELLLLSKVRIGDISEVKALLNELLGHVLFSEGGQISAMRLHAIELTTLLSRVAIEGGARTDSIHALSSHFLELMTKEQSIDELCYLLQDVAESFMDIMFSRQDKGNCYIRTALRHMTDNYAQPLTLASVAETVGLSPGYFSMLFHEIVGVSFREHLCRIRVEESKHLLRSTDYSLTDIAAAMGFTDQSYYCKVFKRIVGVTPGKYRKE